MDDIKQLVTPATPPTTTTPGETGKVAAAASPFTIAAARRHATVAQQLGNIAVGTDYVTSVRRIAEIDSCPKFEAFVGPYTLQLY